MTECDFILLESWLCMFVCFLYYYIGMVREPAPRQTHPSVSLIGRSASGLQKYPRCWHRSCLHPRQAAAAAVMEGGLTLIRVVTTVTACPFTVNKRTTPKAGSQQQGGSRPGQGHGPPDVVPACTYQDGRTEQNGGRPAGGDCTFETPAIVLEQISREVSGYFF